MKPGLYLLLLIAILAGCKKDKGGSAGPGITGAKLVEVKMDGNKYEGFEYTNNSLSKEGTYFSMCSTPVDEFSYFYKDGKLDRLQTTLRSMFSSSSSICNPAMGTIITEQFEYDAQGRISKITRPTAYTVFDYNSAGQVIKQTNYLPNGTVGNFTTFTYDARGNIQEETNQLGTTRYEYDNKVNPYYKIRRTRGWVSAFHSSPNNVIRGISTSHSFERRIISYNQQDMPLRVEENGAVFTFTYQ